MRKRVSNRLRGRVLSEGEEEEEEEEEFLKIPSSRDQLLQSTTICGPINHKCIFGPIELEFYKDVHDM
jgi:hypothetical protein